MLKIRKYVASDAEEVGKIIADTYSEFNLSFASPEDRKSFLGPFQYARSQENSHQEEIARVLKADILLVAIQDRRIAGVLRGKKDKLQSLFVSGIFHRQGIGRSLVERFEQECIKQGSGLIRLMATLYAVPFYLAVGYKKTTGGQENEEF